MHVATIILFTFLMCLVPQKILIVGDSEACAMKFGAVKAVRTSEEKVDIDCVGGTRVGWWSNGRMKQALSKEKYDVVIVFLGTNDYGMKPDPSKVVQDITDSGAACVWVGPPLVRGKRSATNEHLKANVSPCLYLDSQALGVPLADGVHPTGAGAVKWLKKAWQMKNELLKKDVP